MTCRNDTNGDGDCTACARNPDAPCRQAVQLDEPIGPPLQVEGVTFSEDGREVHVSFEVPRDHPAYGLLTAGITDGLSIG